MQINIVKFWCFLVFMLLMSSAFSQEKTREVILLDKNWHFYKYPDAQQADSLIYDVRPAPRQFNDSQDADTKPSEAQVLVATQPILKPFIMPTGNAFIADPSERYIRPEGNPGSDFPFVQADFDDSAWQTVEVPHDWAITGPFYQSDKPEVGGGMGRLPSQGVAWYRRSLDLTQADMAKTLYLDIDGAMSYAMVWVNGQLVGGWPYGYNSWRLDISDFVHAGSNNQIAIRVDNPNYSARWYPGGGLYRSVWLVKAAPVHIGQWGNQIKTHEVTATSANIEITTTLNNSKSEPQQISVSHDIYEIDYQDQRAKQASVSIAPTGLMVAANSRKKLVLSTYLKNPKLWGPKPTQVPHRYEAVSRVWQDGKVIDEFSTAFGIRELEFDPNQGVIVNGELIKIQGVNQHHDLGALGAAFNVRAAERQLEILQEMGVNAIRMAHNPPARELLTLTDKMGFMVVDEVFDSWKKKKTPLDFHLIFTDWYEQDLRSMVRRDRNHPSIIIWSYGNEVGEQYSGQKGADLAQHLREITHSEDGTRPTTNAMNWAKPFMPFSAAMEVISMNYQGEGIRQSKEFDDVTDRIKTKPQYEPFHKAHPDKIVLTSESASAISSRGVYTFPVTPNISSPVRGGNGGNPDIGHVSAYDLYAVDFGSSADKVFRSINAKPFVAGQFVWTGWDYLGEPTPYYSSRSSYSGIIDLAGFKKNRYYLYQSQWRKDLPLVHILPHWNWPERVGKVTPIHVFSSGDEVELFVNDQSKGRKALAEGEYRFRWDDIVYEPGEVRAIAYKDGKVWAENSLRTTGQATSLVMSPDRKVIDNDGKDLAFVTISVRDQNGDIVPNADNKIQVSVSDNAVIVATDNGDQTDFTPFPSSKRNAFSGLMLAIIKAKPDSKGPIVVTASAQNLAASTVEISLK